MYEYDNARTGMALALCARTSEGHLTFALSPSFLGVERTDWTQTKLVEQSLPQANTIVTFCYNELLPCITVEIRADYRS